MIGRGAAAAALALAAGLGTTGALAGGDAPDETVNVSASRLKLEGDQAGASVTVLDAADIAASPAGALDDLLRLVPGFSLFRRTGSRWANPTTQGAALRGIGPSGASRAAVLDDGIPLNDPFGGWVAWGRVPRAALARVEVLRGGASEIYGSPALSGAVSLVRRDPREARVALDAAWGAQGTGDASLYAAGAAGAWAGAFAASGYRTAGFVAVDPAQRGAVDAAVASRAAALDLALERRFGAARVFVRGASFEEARENGTPLQENVTHWRSAAAGADVPLGRGVLALRGWAGRENYTQTFSSIAATRASESLTREQEVPSRAGGLFAAWSQPIGRATLTAGLEGRTVDGTTREVIHGRTLGLSEAGARQVSGAAFVDAAARWRRLRAALGVRYDDWTDTNAATMTRSAPGAREVRGTIPRRTAHALSPRLALALDLGRGTALTASAYRAFRAPTLNELYRSFRAGNVLTLANAHLAPETLAGGESGVAWRARRAALRATAFWLELDDPVTNVTLSTTPSLVTRERRNVGRARSRGIEADAELRLAPSWDVYAAYTFTEATIERNPADPTLAGRRTPQVPRHAAAAALRFADPAIVTATLEARFASRAWEDDRNTLALASCVTADALAERQLGRGIALFAAVENLFDRRCPTGRTPVVTLGPPRAWRLGVRVTTP